MSRWTLDSTASGSMPSNPRNLGLSSTLGCLEPSSILTRLGGVARRKDPLCPAGGVRMDDLRLGESEAACMSMLSTSDQHEKLQTKSLTDWTK